MRRSSEIGATPLITARKVITPSHFRQDTANNEFKGRRLTRGKVSPSFKCFRLASSLWMCHRIRAPFLSRPRTSKETLVHQIYPETNSSTSRPQPVLSSYHRSRSKSLLSSPSSLACGFLNPGSKSASTFSRGSSRTPSWERTTTSMSTIRMARSR